jgi:hypothetical protein
VGVLPWQSEAEIRRNFSVHPGRSCCDRSVSQKDILIWSNELLFMQATILAAVCVCGIEILRSSMEMHGHRQQDGLQKRAAPGKQRQRD